ncbi:DUF4136 domain-containing protein [Moheibacter lacus]|uniref:DUF4136 domain-containing protein n=1 Tax=Moheibacter lacus TaxID=2745851 RepID=A0A838ZR94_9FLAO|nr:DUF4136 domain-containing protein [Moheibacter lacus]MBA5628713.1 DUF4136 domain-containing protein [Moheibacter lacus]
MKNLILFFSSIFLISCSTQTVSVDYDRNQDFSKIQDYHFEFMENTMSELDIQRIQSAIQQELHLKGMNYDENSTVKIKIVQEEYISEKQDSQVGIGVGGGNYGFGTSVGMSIPINSEKLNQHYLVSIFNAENQLVWDGRLDIQMPANANPETIDANVKKGVRKLFKKYPPAKK